MRPREGSRLEGCSGRRDVIRRLCGPNEGKDEMTDGRDVCNPLHYYKVPFTGIGI
jgi:hypothetical protein